MKLNLAFLFLLAAAVNAQPSEDATAEERREECFDCLEDIDDARDCLRTCNDAVWDPDDTNATLAENGSLLNNCLDPSRSDSIDSLDELIECCNMDDDCEDDMEDAQECVQVCLGGCLVDTAKAWLDCVQDENDGITDDDCSRQKCLDGFLTDIEDEFISDDLQNSNSKSSTDLLDLEAVEKRIKKIDEDDLEDCELLEDFVDTICDIGDDCCERCTEELGVMVDCVINDVVIPFVAIELNTTIDECPIDTEECELDLPSGSRKNRKNRKERRKNRRALTAEEEKLFDKVMALPRSKRDTRKEAALKKADAKRALQGDVATDDAIDACDAAMQMNTLAHNVTYASSVFVECVTAAVVAALPEETSAASSVFMSLAQLAVAGATLFALF